MLKFTKNTNLLEKVITLDDVSLIDFLGVENKNIKEVASAFPESKIVSRGNEIRVQGKESDVVKILDILNSLVVHYHKYGKITSEHIQNYIVSDEESQVVEASDEEVLVYGTRGMAIKAKTPNQKKLVEKAKHYDLLFVVGPAGTGKTYISVALAVKALKNKQVKKIIITRPAVEAGENLGFLPGDLKEKIDPYLRPIYDSLDDMIPPEKLKYYIENRIIEIAPLAYMRGRTLNEAFILLDEAQNTTPMQLKMFLTRMGPNSKVIITGDQSQIDLPQRQKSGLIQAMAILNNIEGIAMIELEGADILRHRLVKDIIQAYDREEKDTHQ